MFKKLFLVAAVLPLCACSAGPMAAFTAVGAGGAYVNHLEKDKEYLTADETVDAVTDAFKRDEFEGFETND